MTTATEHQPTDLSEYIRVLRSRKFEIAIVTIVLVAATMFFSFRQTPIYEGSAKVLVKPVQSAGSSVAIPQQPNLDTERELVLSQTVAQKVQRDARVGTPVDILLERVKVQVVTDTEVMEVKYEDQDPATAARLANAFAAAYVGFRSEQALDQFEAAAAAVQRRIDGIKENLTSLNRRIQSASDPATEDALRAERDSFVAQLAVLEQRLLDLQSNASVAQGSAQIVQQADVPTSPASPNKARNGILALFAGLALGIGLAFLRERLDDRIKTRQEIERRLGAPVLAAVPRTESWKSGNEARLVMRAEPKSPASEAYRTLGTNIQYLASRQSLKVMMVTSSLGGDGKTTTSANLAVALAQAGKRVILVSADLRRPRIHQFFSLPNDVGLSDALAGSIPTSKVTRDAGIRTLRVINAGPIPNDPAALLGSERTGDFLRGLRQVCDFVVIDTPPVLAVADASILAPLVDGTVFVMDAGQSSRSALTQARDQLENAGANIIGAVYSNFEPGQSAYYPYYYNYYQQYYAEDAPPNGGRFRKRRRRNLPDSSYGFAPMNGGSPGSKGPAKEALLGADEGASKQ
ncbi:MAG: polysaccharide biosynthesis tyrosine autokinase [Actinomycetota bacterium]